MNDEVRSQAQGQADLVAATAADLLAPARRGELAALARTSAAAVRGRVLVVDRAGIVLADSATPPELGESYARRPEIASALHGRRVQLQRPSRTLGRGNPRHGGAGHPQRQHGGRGAGDPERRRGACAVRRVELGLALIGAVVLAVGLAVGVVIAGQIARPLGRLERVARRVAGGDLSARATIEGSREQRSLGASFNEMTDRVQRLLGSQRAFVADASHQLRTPLTGLRLRIEEARAAGVSPAAGGELDAGMAEVDRLAQIVEELLVLSRAGEREQPGERLDLQETVERALGRWRASAVEREIALERGQLNGGAAWCAAADADRALDVLLENALHYAPPGSQVVVSSAPGSIEVRDRGPGLSVEDGESIFERFHRGSAGRNGPPGSGLGSGDRTRAGARVGRRGDAAQPRRRWRHRHPHTAAGYGGSMSRQAALWMLAAVVGIVLTAGITWATSQLTSQHIGISSEPLSAGHGLAPPVAERSAPKRSRPTPKVTPTVTAPPAAAPSQGTANTTSQVPRATASPSTSIAPATPAPAAPPVRTLERAPASRTSGSSGDDGGDHRQNGRERASQEGSEEGSSSRGRDD